MGLNKCDFTPFEILALIGPLTFKNVNNNEMQKEEQEKLIGGERRPKHFVPTFGLSASFCSMSQAGDDEQKNVVQPQSRVLGLGFGVVQGLGLLRVRGCSGFGVVQGSGLFGVWFFLGFVVVWGLGLFDILEGQGSGPPKKPKCNKG